jgi:hypothetical protein
MRVLDKIVGAIITVLFISIWMPNLTPDQQRGQVVIWVISCVVGFYFLLIIRGIAGFKEGDKYVYLQDPAALCHREMEEYRMFNGIKKSFELPSPYNLTYYGNMDVWNGPGYWQDQWRKYKAGKASVYNAPAILPQGCYIRDISSVQFWFYDDDGKRYCAMKAS